MKPPIKSAGALTAIVQQTTKSKAEINTRVPGLGKYSAANVWTEVIIASTAL
ncbi:hypothetical protein [Pseudomonas sp.]|uniref:hypothetical protein n=1 Tax=Pseudomonas sp. TaxID=306 RepID=UPI0028ADA15A|nr:hypothetical protein [Pseudomonas sp.]